MGVGERLGRRAGGLAWLFRLARLPDFDRFLVALLGAVGRRVQRDRPGPGGIVDGQLVRTGAQGPHAATGHVADDTGSLTAAPTWALARSNAPAGSMLTMRARDLLAFAQLHEKASEEGGIAEDVDEEQHQPQGLHDGHPSE